MPTSQCAGRRYWFETPDERRWLAATTVATGLHAGLLAALFLWSVGYGTGSLEPVLDSGWAEDQPVADPTPLVLVPLAAEVNPDAGGRSPASLIATAQPSSSRAVPRTVVRGGTLPVGTVASGAGLLEAVAAIEMGDEANGAGLGNGTGTGVGDGQAGGFFGMNAPGRTFVYVVDASSSMYAVHDSEAKTRFGRVQVEMVRSIGNMTPQQAFFVLFFNSVPRPMPAQAMQPGLPEVKRRYLEWMARQRAGGDTNPLPALELAIALRPDVVYFLTDGELPRGQNVLREVTRVNRGGTRIHTFAFGSRNGEELLKELAKRNGGEYHFVE